MISCRRWQCGVRGPPLREKQELLVVRAWLLSPHLDAGRAKFAVRWCDKLVLALTNAYGALGILWIRRGARPAPRRLSIASGGSRDHWLREPLRPARRRRPEDARAARGPAPSALGCTDTRPPRELTKRTAHTGLRAEARPSNEEKTEPRRPARHRSLAFEDVRAVRPPLVVFVSYRRCAWRRCA